MSWKTLALDHNNLLGCLLNSDKILLPMVGQCCTGYATGACRHHYTNIEITTLQLLTLDIFNTNELTVNKSIFLVDIINYF